MKLQTIFIACFLGLMLMTSCKKDWNERNFGDLMNRTENPNIDKNVVLTMGNTEIEALVKIMKDQAKELAKADSLTLIKKADSLNNTKQFPSEAFAREWLPVYLKSLDTKKAGDVSGLISSLVSGSEIVVDYRVFVNPDAEKFQQDTLQVGDYDAMGTADGTPGRYDNFDATMKHLEYLLVYVAQKYPYAKESVKIAVTYKFYIGSGLGTTNFTEVFIKTADGWQVVQRQDRFQMQSDRNWTYVNTLILSKTFSDGSLAPFVGYNLIGEGDGKSKGFWYYDSKYGAYCSEYYGSKNNAGDDWLVSPEMDLSDRTVARVTFEAMTNFWGTENDMEIYASDTYVEGNPVENQWTKLEGFDYKNKPKNNTFNPWKCSLDAFCGKSKVRIAFRYRSTASAAGTLEVKNVIVEAKSVDE